MTAPLVVILAGGDGRRIGGDKALRRLGGERLVDRAARTAGGWSDDVRVSLRDRAQIPILALPVLIDAPGLSGPLAGLKSALAAAKAAGRPAVLTIPCDTPFLPADLAERLMAVRGAPPAVLAATPSGPQPACALWRVEALDSLPVYLESRRRSLLGFAEAVGFEQVLWPEAPFFNVNRAEDLEEAQARLGQKGRTDTASPRVKPG